MIKTTLMLLGLAAVFVLSMACFGLSSSKKDPNAPSINSTNSPSIIPR